MKIKTIQEDLHVAKELAKHEWESRDAVEIFLKQQGYEMLNDGCNSEVYTKPNENFVIKVSYYYDPAWLHFASFVMTQPKNPHFPKISRVKQYISKDRGSSKAFIAFIEKLSPLTSGIADIHLLGCYMICFIKTIPIDLISRRDRHQALWKRLTMQALGITRISQQEIQTYANEFRQKYPGFVNTTDQILQNAPPFDIDLHDGNIMFRLRTGDFVIVDPYA